MLIANRASLWTRPTRTVHLVNNVIPSHIEFEWRQEKVPSVWAPPAHPVDTFLRLLVASAWVLWWWWNKRGVLKSAGIVGGQHTTQGWCGNMGKTNTEAWAAQWVGREKKQTKWIWYDNWKVPFPFSSFHQYSTFFLLFHAAAQSGQFQVIWPSLVAFCFLQCVL